MSKSKGCLFSITQFLIIFGRGKYYDGRLEVNRWISNARETVIVKVLIWLFHEKGMINSVIHEDQMLVYDDQLLYTGWKFIANGVVFVLAKWGDKV